MTIQHRGTAADAADWTAEPDEFHGQIESTAKDYAPEQAPPDTPRTGPPTRESLAILPAEIRSAELTPKCLVRDHLYADVAQKVAPGGVGKTTHTLYEALHIVLGRDLYGCRVENPGWVLLVTAEDQRGRLIARLSRIMDGMDLDDDDRATVLASICIWDVTGEQAKLIADMGGNIMLTTLADQIVDAYRNDPPALVEFDPAVSFGASESRINDNEQGLILAARRIVRGLDCCVRYIHHTGKANARDKTSDQYSGRGGSAFADGSRMTAVLQSWSPEDKTKPPATLAVHPDDSVMVYHRAKLSYAPPNQPPIWIKRTGFRFEWAVERRQSPDEAKAARANQLLRFIESEVKAGRLHTKTTLREQTDELSMTQREISKAVSELELDGRVMDAELPPEQRRGKRKTYLCPAVRDEVRS